MERSKKYDWFKGPQGKNKKDSKENLKVVWKFTKIFLLFIVLFISLWGCVQGFIVKQSSYVGRGIEAYLNEEDIPPHITEFQEQGQEIVTSPENLYSLSPTNKNIWLKREDNGPKTMELVHKELFAQGLSSMSDAYEGVNEAVRITNSEHKAYEPILMHNGRPIVISSASSHKSLGQQKTTNLDDTLKNINLLRNQITYDDNGVSKEAINVMESLNFTPITNLSGAQAERFEALDNFRHEIFDALNKNNWITNALSLKGNYSIYVSGALPLKPANTQASAGTPLNLNNIYEIDQTRKSYYDAIVNAQARALGVLSYLGYKVSDFVSPSKIEDHKIALTNWNLTPGQGGETYIPILTWSQAWVRGVGPFYGMVVFPIAKFQAWVASAFNTNMHGWDALLAMIIAIFVLRFIGFLISFKSTLQQTKMQELSLKKAAIDAKYAPYKGNKQMLARQRQEIADMYKKEGISPLGAFSNSLITMPLFLAVWKVIGSIPQIKSADWYGINFSATSYQELFHGNFLYLPIMIAAIAMSIISQLYPKFLTRKRDKQRGNAHLKQAMKKGNKTQIIIMIVTAGVSVMFSAGIQIYWIVVAIWAMMQSQLTHHILQWKNKKNKQKASS